MVGELHSEQPESTGEDLAKDRLTEEELATIRERLADPRPNISVEELATLVDLLSTDEGADIDFDPDGF